MSLEQELSTMLKKLSNSDLKLIKSGKLSDEEIKFITSNISNKLSAIEYDANRSELYATLTGSDIPNEVSNYNKIYLDYEDDCSSPNIISKKYEFPNISLIVSSYDTDHMRSTDHMDRDYGCYGSFSERRVFYQGNLAIIEAHSCSCHSNGPNKFYGFSNENDHRFLKVYNLDEPVIDSINQLFESVKKKEKISDIEKKTGMSADQLREFLK
jgi:hypothetical protein